MNKLIDLQHFVLQPGEKLILRCTKNFTQEQLQHMRKLIDRYLPGQTVLVLPPEIEVYAGALEVMGAEAEPPELTQEDIDARRAEIRAAYDLGRNIYVSDTTSDDTTFYAFHKRANPHVFNWDRYTYSLTPIKA